MWDAPLALRCDAGPCPPPDCCAWRPSRLLCARRRDFRRACHGKRFSFAGLSPLNTPLQVRRRWILRLCRRVLVAPLGARDRALCGLVTAAPCLCLAVIATALPRCIALGVGARALPLVTCPLQVLRRPDFSSCRMWIASEQPR